MSTNVVRLRRVTSFGLINKDYWGKKSKSENCCNVPHLPLQICRSWKQQWHNSRQRAHSPSRTESINWCKASINVSVHKTIMWKSDFGVDYNLVSVIYWFYVWFERNEYMIGILDTTSYKQLDQWKVLFSSRHSFNLHWSLLCVFVIKATRY
jgi:hypothetical protein